LIRHSGSGHPGGWGEKELSMVTPDHPVSANATQYHSNIKNGTEQTPMRLQQNGEGMT
jgi:hypothetical protein